MTDDRPDSHMSNNTKEPLALKSNEGLGPVPRWWHCDKHGPGTHTAWGCPECVVELRSMAREQAVEIQRLRDALNIAGGALWRQTPAWIEGDDERAKAEHARAVGLAAVEAELKRPVYVDGVGLRGGFPGPNVGAKLETTAAPKHE